MYVVAMFFLLMCSILWIRRPKRPALFPPGPPTFLIFGNLWTIIEAIKGNFPSVVKASRQKFGDIFAFVHPTGDKEVHLCNFDDIKEVCKRQEFAGRPQSFPLLVRSYQQKLGLFFSEGPSWREHRRFALQHLRDLGLGKTSMESIILEEFEQLANEMAGKSGSPMEVVGHFNLTVLNIIWRLVAGTRLDRSDEKAQRHAATVREFFETIGPTNPLNFAPWLRHLLPEWSSYASLIRHRDTTTDMLAELIREHKRTLNRSSPRDFIDLFLLEMESPDAEARQFTEQNLTIISMDFLIAGMDTTANWLSWALLLLVRNPQVQERVQREIDTVLGRAAPTSADRARLPFTEATMMEVSRRAPVAPLAAPHSALSDATFHGYTIPKNTTLVLHLHCVFMDPDYWGDPLAFRPERFLQPDGSVRRDERLIPFGIGKRLCLGETLARTETFMLLTCLLQRFRFSAAPDQRLSLESSLLFVQPPRQFSVTYELRD
ncbi:methyl farnesoate epoxidase-like [Pollicipes pollicipes]|uniref:methyl farnesoate epoxidase-like n=1 Tax=Pollicipes pollicipes TaxID=41117 RepID=UPI00188592EE|nr:methyl farnesoate epoxidase-like [Pollicipes pollicipes]